MPRANRYFLPGYAQHIREPALRFEPFKFHRYANLQTGVARRPGYAAFFLVDTDFLVDADAFDEDNLSLRFGFDSGLPIE